MCTGSNRVKETEVDPEPIFQKWLGCPKADEACREANQIVDGWIDKIEKS